MCQRSLLHVPIKQASLPIEVYCIFRVNNGYVANLFINKNKV